MKWTKAMWIASLCVSACSAPRVSEAQWDSVVCHETRGAIERIRIGRPGADDPQLQAVSVDQAGDVALVHFSGANARSRVLYRNGTELTGLAIADLDPTTPGAEIYVGGYLPGAAGEEKGGAVFQVIPPADAEHEARTRMIWSGTAYVHSLEAIEPEVAGGERRLLVSTYAGEVHELAFAPGASAWNARLLHTEPPSSDPEANKIKDAGFLRGADGRAGRVALVAFKTGRLLWLDVDHPETARMLLDEPGGLSRITADPDGGAYVTGYFGRLLHLVRVGDGFRIDVLDREGMDSGLRGAVMGKFPAGGTVAHMAVFGFHRLCRALVPRQGVFDPITLKVDVDRGHTIDAADLVPGNDADEILIGGYSHRVTMLVARGR